MNIKKIISLVLSLEIISYCSIFNANAESRSIIESVKCGMAESEVINILGNDIVYTNDSSTINPDKKDHTNFYNTNKINEFDVDMNSVIITEFSEDNTLKNYGYNIGTHYNTETQKFEYPYSESELLETYDKIYNQLVQWYGEGTEGNRNIYGAIKEYEWNTQYGEIWFIVGTDLFSSSGMNKIIITCSRNSEKSGDVNGDGEINSIDSSMILADYAKVSSGGTSSLDIKISDVNGDGEINSSDSSLILSYYAYTSSGGNNDFQDFIKNI